MKPTLLKRLYKAGLVAGFATLLCLPSRAAITLFLSPSAQTINVGQTAYVDLKVTGLSGTLLGGWSADIVYGPGLVLDVPGFTFGTELSVGAASTNFAADYGAWFHADETADATADLSGQVSQLTLTLGTYSFVGLSAGLQSVGFDAGGAFNSLTGEGGLTGLVFDNGPDVVIQVLAPSGQGVPDGGVAMPLALCIGTMFLSRRLFRLRQA
jgi:hypothetical protein